MFWNHEETVYLFTSSKTLDLPKLTLYHMTKILDWSKLIVLAVDKMNMAQMRIFVFDTEGNTVEKGENTGYQHFLLFQKSSSSGSFNLGLFGTE